MPPVKKTTKTEGPKYSELIKAALLGLKERNGSSLAAIKKYMASNFPAAKVRLTRRRATCRITLLPGFPRVPLRLPTPQLLLIPTPSLPGAWRVSRRKHADASTAQGIAERHHCRTRAQQWRAVPYPYSSMPCLAPQVALAEQQRSRGLRDQPLLAGTQLRVGSLGVGARP